MGKVECHNSNTRTEYGIIMPTPNYPLYLCRAIERSTIAISVVYTEILVQP